MFGKSSLPPPPSVNQSRNDSLGATLPTYRSRPAGASGSSTMGSGLNFSSVRSMFETAKPMGAAVASLARNPLIQNAAVAVAKDEKLRGAALAAAQSPHVRSAAVDYAMRQSSTSRKPAQSSVGWSTRSATTTITNSAASLKVDEIAHQFENRPIMGFSAPPSNSAATNFVDAFAGVAPLPPIGQKPTVKSIYPALAQRNPFDFPPQLPSSRMAALYDDTRSVDDGGDYDGYAPYQKKTVPPSRPPPPKMTLSRSNPSLNRLADELRGIDFSATAASPPPGTLNESYAIVKYPYREANADELTCQPDDVVILKREVDDQWIYATNTRTGRSGIVPLLFLQIRVPLAPMNRDDGGPLNSDSTISGRDEPPSVGWRKSRDQMCGQCVAARALYDYATGVEGDLQFNTGDTIVVKARVNADWLRGETRGRNGIFPLNYVTFEHPSDLDRLANERGGGAAPAAIVGADEILTAAFDYVSDVADDLLFRAGDRVAVLQRHEGGQWVTGRLERTGETGLVPLTYMKPPNT